MVACTATGACGAHDLVNAISLRAVIAVITVRHNRFGGRADTRA